MAHAVEIYPGIWIGDAYSAEDINFLRRFKIGVIVNMTKDFPNFFENESSFSFNGSYQRLDENNIKYFRLGVDDWNENTVKKDKKNYEINNFIDNSNLYLNEIVRLYKSGKNILIHCIQGKQRSTAFAVLLLYHLGIPKNEAYQIIRNKKPDSFKDGKEIHFFRGIKEVN